MDRDLNEQLKELYRRVVLDPQPKRCGIAITLCVENGVSHILFEIPLNGIIERIYSFDQPPRYTLRCADGGLVFEDSNILFSTNEDHTLSDYFYDINNITKEEKELLLMMAPQLHKILTNIGILQ